MRLHVTVLICRVALYAAAMTAWLWYAHGFKRLIEAGTLTRGESFRQMATMVSVMAFVATAVWVFTWKYQEEYGTKVAILTSVLLTGVGLYLFGFVLSAVPILVTNTRLFFQGETTLAYLFLDIPLAAIASGVAVGVTGLLFRSRSRSAGTEE